MKLLNYLAIFATLLAVSVATPKAAEVTIVPWEEGHYDFEDWAAMEELPEEEALPGSAPAADGVLNILKFALGIPARSASRVGLPQPVYHVEDGQIYRALLLTRAQSAFGARIRLEVSDDLKKWDLIDVEPEVLEEAGEGVEWVRLRDPAPVGPNGSRFMRVRVSADGHTGYSRISGGHLEVLTAQGDRLAAATLGETGAYQLFFGAAGKPAAHRLIIRDGLIDGVPFTGTLSALFLEHDAFPQMSATLLTTLVDALTTSDLVSGEHLAERRNAAITLLTGIGMIQPEEWHLPYPASVHFEALWSQVAESGGIAEWSAALLTDLSDGELRPKWMDGFPWAHGGILGASASGEGFKNHSYSSSVEVRSVLLDPQTYTYTLVSGPNGLSLNPDNGVIQHFIPAGAPTGHVSFSYRVTNQATGKGRQFTDSVYVMETQIMAEGTVGPEGGRITDDWDDVVLRVPGPGGITPVPAPPDGITLFSVTMGDNEVLYALGRSETSGLDVIEIYTFDGFDWVQTAELGDWGSFLPGDAATLADTEKELNVSDGQKFYIWLTVPHSRQTSLVQFDLATSNRTLLLSSQDLLPSSAIIPADGKFCVPGFYMGQGFPDRILRFAAADGALTEVSALPFEGAQAEPFPYGQVLRLRKGPGETLYAYNDARGAEAIRLFQVNIATGQASLIYDNSEGADFDDLAMGEDGTLYVSGTETIGGRIFGYLDAVHLITNARSRIATTEPLGEESEGEIRLGILSQVSGGFLLEADSGSGSLRLLFRTQIRGAFEEETLFRVLRGIREDGHYIYAVQTDPANQDLNGHVNLLVPSFLGRALELAREGDEEPQPMAMAMSSPTPQTQPVWRVWQSGYANFLQIRSTIRTAQATNQLPYNSGAASFFEDQQAVRIVPLQSYELLGYTGTDSHESRHNSAVPVLFVHGFSLGGGLGGEADTWGQFREILASEVDSNGNPRFIVFEFRYRSNARFQEIARDLNAAIQRLQQVYPKKVHIVAHSFGGLVARTYIQGLAGISYNHNVASLITLSTPHSGIFATEGIRWGQWFPNGTQGFSGDTLLLMNRQSSAYQAGHSSRDTYTLHTTQAIDLRSVLGLENQPGWIVAQLGKTQVLPVPTRSVMALSSEMELRRRELTLLPGDGLISLQGQRFHPTFDADYRYPSLAPLEAVVHVPSHKLPGSTTYDLASWDTYRHNSAVLYMGGNRNLPVARVMHNSHRAYQMVLAWLEQHANPLDTVILPGITISLRVVDADDGQPIGGASVRLIANGPELSPSQTDEPAGRFVFAQIPFQAGTRYIFTVEHAGYRSVLLEVSASEVPYHLSDLGIIRLHRDMPGRGGFQATVTGRDEPLAGASWSLFGTAPPFMADHLNWHVPLRLFSWD